MQFPNVAFDEASGKIYALDSGIPGMVVRDTTAQRRMLEYDLSPGDVIVLDTLGRFIRKFDYDLKMPLILRSFSDILKFQGYVWVLDQILR